MDATLPSPLYMYKRHSPPPSRPKTSDLIAIGYPIYKKGIPAASRNAARPTRERARPAANGPAAPLVPPAAAKMSHNCPKLLPNRIHAPPKELFLSRSRKSSKSARCSLARSASPPPCPLRSCLARLRSCLALVRSCRALPWSNDVASGEIFDKSPGRICPNLPPFNPFSSPPRSVCVLSPSRLMPFPANEPSPPQPSLRRPRLMAAILIVHLFPCCPFPHPSAVHGTRSVCARATRPAISLPWLVITVVSATVISW